MKKPLHFLLIKTICLFSLLTAGFGLHATSYYFSSTDGDDSRSVAQAQNPSSPWRSISKLNAFFSSLRPGDAVYFKRGDVFEGAITATASGSIGAPIVLGAYGAGNAPVVSGLRSLTGWAATGGNIWEASVPGAQSSLNVLLLNGKLQAIGRYPNASAANGGYLMLESHSGNTSITDNQLPSSPNWTGGEVVIRKNRWVLDRNKITAHSGNTINYISESGYHASNNFGYFLQNHRAALDQSGEWYFDQASKNIGLYTNAAPSSVEVSVVNTLVSITNQNFITIKDLSFKGANGNAIELSNTQGVEVLACSILYSGANALLALGCNALRVEGCTIYGSANCALELRNSSNAVIKGNSIKRTGSVAGMGKGDSGSYEAILMDGDGETVEGNEIDSTGYIPITFRGNVNTIKNNFITNYNYVKDDGGGIYTWNNIAGAATTFGSKIIGNILLNGTGASVGTDWVEYHAANGIYMDDNTAGVEISGNTVANCGLHGLYIHNGYNLTIKNNTFFNSTSQAVFAHDNYAPNAKLRNLVVENNIFFSKEATQVVAEFKTPDNDIPLFGTFDNNYYCRPAYPNYIINTSVNSDAYNLDLAEWKTGFGKDAASKTFPVPATSYEAIRLEYNASASSKAITLDGAYTDAAGNSYNSSITLAPYTSAVLVKQGLPASACAGGGSITREQWNNSANGDLSNVAWQLAPTKTTTVTGALEAGNIGDAYGSRLRGYICPPQTGNYTFWIAGDDVAELWLSTDATPGHKKKIAAVSGWTYLRDWNKAGSQKSASIPLQAGTKYYIEVLHKEGNGGDHVSVAWQLPNGEFEGPIPGYRLSSTAGGGTALQSQTINFAPLASVVLGSGSVTLSATASSGLPVSFSLVSGPATLSGNTLTPTGAGTVVVRASQAGNAQYSAAADVSQSLTVVAGGTALCSATGTILREVWNGVGGNDVSQIPLNTAPSSSSQITLFEGAENSGNAYGSRIRGYICPPLTGNYTFWIAGDDGTELWLSNGEDASAKTKIAYSTSWTNFREWNRYAAQKSASIYLEAGKKYYIEALHKEGGGGDHVSVGWQLPNGISEMPVPGNRLSPFQATAALLNQTISFTAPPNFTLGSAPLTLSATASSGLPVSFSVVSGAATLTGNVLTPTAAGVVVIKASQAGNAQYNAAADVSQSLTVVAASTALCSATGSILREQWNGVAGNDVSQIPVSIQPSSSGQLTSFEAPQNIAENYGSRIRGYICPPQTGNYTFWIAGDDGVELWLSSGESPAAKARIAYHTSWTYFREWNRSSTQKSASIYLEAGKKYYVEALHKEGNGGDHLSVAWQLPDGVFEGPVAGGRLSPYVPVVVAPQNCSATGSILREVWSGISGNDVSQIPLTATPSFSSQISLFEGGKDIADSYGSRIRGYICPPQNGSYTFWIAGDDGTELWLSTSDDPSAKTKIAYSASWTAYREWNRYASQKSASIYLEAGRKYYIEALHKEGGGGDHLSVGWQLPDGTTELPIPGNRLSPYTETNIATRTATESLHSSQTVYAEKEIAITVVELAALKAFPNPFSGQTIVELIPAETGAAVIDVCDVSGRIQQTLYSGSLQKGIKQRFVFGGKALPAGIYFVRYRSGKQFMVYKLVKE